MGQIKVVTDSAASLIPELQEKYQIAVCPYSVQFGSESFVDNGVDMTVAEFEQKRVTSGVVPKTGIPSSGRFVDLYRSIAQPGDTTFSIHCGTKLSGIVGSATIAAGEVPELDVVVFDTNSVGMVEGWMSIAVTEAAAAGADRQALIDLLKELQTRTDFISTSVELEYIKESGRITGGAKASEAAVKTVPIIRVQDGKAGVIEQARTQNAVLRRIIEVIKQRAGDRPVKRLAISHANREEVAARYREMVEKELAPGEISFGQLGITLMTHLGPGSLATSVEYEK
jgi:DegV family protein with EDD domain